MCEACFLLTDRIGEVFGPYTQPTDAEFWDMWTGLRYNDGNLVLDRCVVFVFSAHILCHKGAFALLTHASVLSVSVFSSTSTRG